MATSHVLVTLIDLGHISCMDLLSRDAFPAPSLYCMGCGSRLFNMTQCGVPYCGLLLGSEEAFGPRNGSDVMHGVRLNKRIGYIDQSWP